MRRALRRRLIRLLDDALGGRIDAALSSAAASGAGATEEMAAAVARYEQGRSGELRQLRESVAVLGGQVGLARSELAELGKVVGEIRDITGVHFDRIPELRQRLHAARQSEEYSGALADPEPLVSVRIATYDREDILFERTLPSVLNQSYERLEVILVGDGCSEATVRAAEAVTDPRFRFVNLPHRGVYPEDPGRRWLVAGSPAMNHGAQLATGGWIAPLDDDDEFAPDHIEVLLDTARSGAYEMAYGRMRVITPDSAGAVELGVYPPAHAQFGFQAAIYLSALSFFEFETSSWVLGEPGDWNLCRRMLAAGVRIGYTPQIVTTLYPTGPRRPGS